MMPRATGAWKRYRFIQAYIDGEINLKIQLLIFILNRIRRAFSRRGAFQHDKPDT
jgi:hypothetical protein